MTFQSIAYGPDDHVLVTLDGAELLANDAQTEAPKWRVALARPLLALAFAERGALPGCESANPWRDRASSRFVVAVDDEGALHAVDPVLGQVVGVVAPLGKPAAFATGVGGTVALATEDRVVLWRAGERTEIAARASALAFSSDGATLAVGARDGALRFFSVAGAASPVETFCAVVHGGITALAQHPGGAWLAGGKSGLSLVTSDGATRVDRVPVGVLRLALDARGQRLAVQLSDRTLAVYAFPGFAVETRIEYLERVVGGLAFGAEAWLGVALDHGDGNKIDVETSATHRTDTHPGRTHRSWSLSVQGKATILSAQEAEDVRRMKEPFHTAPEPKSGGARGGRIGVGVVIALALLGLRLCAAGSRSRPPPSWDPAYSPTYAAPVVETKCDKACAMDRLKLLRSQCAEPPADCFKHANAAVSAFDVADCPSAKAALARVSWPGDDHGLASLVDAAKLGLEEACVAGVYSSHPLEHAAIVRLAGPTLTTSIEVLPEANTFEGEEPTQIWSAPDGAVFVVTMADTHVRSVVYRRDPSGSWDRIATRRSTRPAQVWGRSATDLTIMDDDSLAHFDGRKRAEEPPPQDSGLFALAGAGEDTFVAGDSPGDTAAPGRVHRRHGLVAPWELEPTPAGLVVRGLWSGGGATWARAVAGDDDDGTDDRLLQRTAAGKWIERNWYGATRPRSVAVRAVWVSPTAEAFVATSLGVYRSASSGLAWTKTDAPAGILALWGRSSADVYAGTEVGLMHYDGKAWSRTSFRGPVRTLGGTATEVLVGATKP